MFHLRSLLALLALAVLGLSACGGDTHASVAEESIDLMSEAAEILEGVTDVASAEAAAPKLDQLATKMEELQKRAEPLGDPTAEQEADLEKKYQAQMDEIMESMMGSIGRLSTKPEVIAVLDESMRKFQ